MGSVEKLMELRVILGETDDDDATLLSYLGQARDAILNRLYPYRDGMADHEDLEVPKQYASLQVRIAAFLLNKRGAEGETQHIENGVHRNYQNADIPEAMMRNVVPMIGIPR